MTRIRLLVKRLRVRFPYAGWRLLGALGAAFCVLSFVLIWLYVITGRVQKQTDIREAAIQAEYVRCVRTAPLLARINDEFEAAETVGWVILENATATHAITDPGSMLYRQQEKNLARLRRALRLGGVRLPVQTKAECAERRDLEEKRG